MVQYNFLASSARLFEAGGEEYGNFHLISQLNLKEKSLMLMLAERRHSPDRTSAVVAFRTDQSHCVHTELMGDVRRFIDRRLIDNKDISPL